MAAALLLPIPILVATGLRLPLPGAIERGVASLAPGGDVDLAPIGGRPAARSRPAPSTPDAATDRPPGPARARPRAASSTTILVPDRVRPARSEKRVEKAPPEALPRAPVPHTDGVLPSDGPSRTPAERPPSQSAVPEPVASVTPDAPSAPVDVRVDEDGLRIDTGGVADAVPPLEVPIPQPPLPLPVPAPSALP